MSLNPADQKPSPPTAAARDAMRRINRAWLEGRIPDLEPLLHEEIVMAFPDLTASVQGRDQLLAGFRDFCQNAVVHEFQDHDHHVDVAGHVAVVTFRYEMLYERAGSRFKATGRDLWVFEKQAGAWIAVWRTMLDSQETAT